MKVKSEYGLPELSFDQRGKAECKKQNKCKLKTIYNTLVHTANKKYMKCCGSALSLVQILFSFGFRNG